VTRLHAKFWIIGAFALGLGACSTVEPVTEAPVQPAALPPPPPVEAPRVVFNEIGTASWYGRSHHGRKTASGEPYNMNAMTAAHRTLPFNTRARVTNLDTGKTVDVTITDRGPYRLGRIIDLSSRAAQELGMHTDGVAPVRVEVYEGSMAAAPAPKPSSTQAAEPATKAAPPLKPPAVKTNSAKPKAKTATTKAATR
jgi:rare lipoprotein A